jgi:hypothetical protein
MRPGVVCLALVAMSALVVVPVGVASAQPQIGISVTSLVCAPLKDGTVVSPVATLTRNSLNGDDNREQTVMKLYDGSTFLEQLGAGQVKADGSIATGDRYNLPQGSTIDVAPWGATFGDGSADGGAALTPGHTYTVAVAVTDYSYNQATASSSFPCVPSPACTQHLSVVLSAVSAGSVAVKAGGVKAANGCWKITQATGSKFGKPNKKGKCVGSCLVARKLGIPRTGSNGCNRSLQPYETWDASKKKFAPRGAIWAWNEVNPGTKTSWTKACHTYIDGITKGTLIGALYYAHPSWRTSFSPGVSVGLRFLEMYGGSSSTDQQFISAGAEARWMQHRPTYYPMMNLNHASGGDLGTVLPRICKENRQRPIGFFEGSGAVWPSGKLAQLVAGLNKCTTQPV